MGAPHLDQSILRSLVEYEPATGVFIWKERPDARREWNTRYAGKVAGFDWRVPNSNVAYRSIRIFDWPFLGHRLAWLYMTGEWPTQEVDHVDLDGLNNAWANLRAADKAQNGANRSASANNKLGVKGVRTTPGGRFSAALCGQYLGTFDTPDLANAAYETAAKERFGAHGRAR